MCSLTLWVCPFHTSDPGCQVEVIRSFETRPIGQLTHAESNPAFEGLPDESPVEVGPSLPLVGWEFLGLFEDYRQGLPISS